MLSEVAELRGCNAPSMDGLPISKVFAHGENVMSKFEDFRNGCVKAAKNELKRPFKVMKPDAKGKMVAGATFKVVGAAAVTATTFAQAKKAIEKGSDEYMITFAGNTVAGTDGKFVGGSYQTLMDSEDLIASLEGYFKPEKTDKDAKEDAKDNPAERNGNVKDGAPVVN